MTCNDLTELTAQNNLHLFASLTEREQNSLFCLVCKNHLRPYKKSSHEFKKYFAFLKFIFNHLENRDEILQEAQKITKQVGPMNFDWNEYFSHEQMDELKHSPYFMAKSASKYRNKIKIHE